MRCPGGIVVNGRELPQQTTLSSMTRSELTFALLVESLLHHIQLPEYRQIIVEVINFYIFFCFLLLLYTKHVENRTQLSSIILILDCRDFLLK